MSRAAMCRELARLFSEQARIQLEIAHAFEGLHAADEDASSVGAGNDVYTSKALPPGVTLRAFRERCTRLLKQGDDRVFKTSATCWCAKREVFEARDHARRALPANDGGAGWTPELAIAEAIARSPKGRGRT